MKQAKKELLRCAFSRIPRCLRAGASKAGQYAYRDRRQRKRQFRQLDCAYPTQQQHVRTVFLTANSSTA
ncbi:hypothetical protein KCP76_24095 [Salmonella enterica subsp. enterica serovar Weltevreden]|nr:hypothetical protein KCP76_24095 [Salmonella enterica subsp. enterica serovar Weltevreden]